MRAPAGGGTGGPPLRTASRRQPFGRRARTRHGTGSIVASYDDTRGERAWAGRVGRGAAGRGEAEGSSKQRATSGEHMIRRLMRTSHDESARGGGHASRAQHAADVAKPPSALRRGGVSPEQLHVCENGRNYSTVITGLDYCKAIAPFRGRSDLQLYCRSLLLLLALCGRAFLAFRLVRSGASVRLKNALQVLLTFVLDRYAPSAHDCDSSKGCLE
jgi:hypothetical protein